MRVSTTPATGPPDFTAPNAPKTTLASERFMALVMMFVRMRPAAPTSAPLTMSARLPSANPAAAAATPE